MNETIRITVKEYRALKHAEAMLGALQAGGVDSWDWYDDSLQENYDRKAVDAEVDSRIAK